MTITLEEGWVMTTHQPGRCVKSLQISCRSYIVNRWKINRVEETSLDYNNQINYGLHDRSSELNCA